MENVIAKQVLYIFKNKKNKIAEQGIWIVDANIVISIKDGKVYDIGEEYNSLISIVKTFHVWDTNNFNKLDWIDATKKLPKKDGKYLCAFKNEYSEYYEVLGYTHNRKTIDEYDLDDKRGFYDYDNEYGYFAIDNVCFWTTFPQPEFNN